MLERTTIDVTVLNKWHERIGSLTRGQNFVNKLQAIKAFTHVAERRGFTAAAKKLGMCKVGDLVVCVQGTKEAVSGSTNHLNIVTVSW